LSSHQSIMVGWRSVGINYVRYSQLAAQVVRKSVKGEAVTKKAPATVKITKWEDGKPIKKD
ncbi:hypothetical protein PRIPAC_93098, partial [Pristionchus pacificus]|uniref:ATP synthase subunit epsilon, mitochondrial n=1 Tax=Pristionchus pacificus TaxID=54126 RepID=A0A8R1Z7R9_PRIPA